MDIFLSNTNKLREYYYNKVPEENEKELIDINKMMAAADNAILGIRGLQYLGYYLYRIWFKYLALVLESSDIVLGKREKVMEPVLYYLDIGGSEKKAIFANLKPLPLVNRMTNDPNRLNSLVVELQVQLINTIKYHEAIAPGARNKLYSALIAFMGKKQKMENVLEDITRLKLLAPGLGRASSVA